MAKFSDKLGREWGVEVTLGLLPKLREAGFNVGEVAKDPEAIAVLNDPEVLGRVLWALCGAEAEGRNVTPEQFAGALHGPAVHGALDAIGEAVFADFSQRPAVAEAIKRKLPGQTERFEAEQIRRVEAALSPPPAKSTEGRRNPTGSNATGGNSLASLASTPGG